jgi:hypothetical protein
MKIGLLLAAATMSLAAGCTIASGSATASYNTPTGLGIDTTSRMKSIEASQHRSMASQHQVAGLEDKMSEMEQKARRQAESRRVVSR